MHDVKVKDVMTSLVVTLRKDDSVHEAATRLARSDVSGGPVLEDGRVIGVVSEADLIRAVLPPVHVDHGGSILDMLSILTRAQPRQHPHGKTVGEVMNPIPICIAPDESIWSAALMMERRGVKRLPVVDEEGLLLGIISRADLVKTMARSDETLKEDVISAILILGDETIHDLEVEVGDGVATIEGTADRRSTHESAVRLASSVPGVIEVIDRMDHVQDDQKHPHAKVKIDPRENWNADIAVIEGRR